MENLDVMVLRALRAWRRDAKRALLATVVGTWGSSPRPVGSVMALCEDGTVVGSVSGGCIEDDLIAQYADHNVRRVLRDSAPRFVKYGVTADEAHQFGLPCGGTLELMLEFNPDAAALDALVLELEQGNLMQRTVNLSDGTVQLQKATAAECLSVSATTLSSVFGPEYRMLLIGAGQLTEYLATMALFNGFVVTVCDPREEYRRSWSVGGVTLLAEMPDDVVTALKPDRRTCVIALTHDPKLDDMALLEALHTEAFYVGAIGSRRNNRIRRQRMIDHLEQTPADVARLRGPIGIYIGSKTPSEIAVSIMAEVIAIKNGCSLPKDMDVAQAKNNPVAAAVHS